MKLVGNNMDWVQTTSLDDFKEKAVIPPSQKKSPEYKGKMYERALAMVTPNGELIISGQKFTMKSVQDPKYPADPSKKIRVKDAYKDLVMFHFDNKGSLKAQYGIKRDKNNKYSKAVLTPQEVALSGDGNTLYWTYGELKGMRKGLELGGVLKMAGVGTLSKKKCCTTLQLLVLTSVQPQLVISCLSVQMRKASRSTTPIQNTLVWFHQMDQVSLL